MANMIWYFKVTRDASKVPLTLMAKHFFNTIQVSHPHSGPFMMRSSLIAPNFIHIHIYLLVAQWAQILYNLCSEYIPIKCYLISN